MKTTYKIRDSAIKHLKDEYLLVTGEDISDAFYTRIITEAGIHSVTPSSITSLQFDDIFISIYFVMNKSKKALCMLKIRRDWFSTHKVISVNATHADYAQGSKTSLGCYLKN